jgi:tetratricopeptide (TPR) repeat protein
MMRRILPLCLVLAIAPYSAAYAQGFNKTCDSWIKGRKGVEYYLMVSSAEDYLKATLNAAREAQGLTKDPMQGVTTKDIAAWLDSYCASRPQDLQESALKAYANELLPGATQAKPKTEARTAAAQESPPAKVVPTKPASQQSVAPLVAKAEQDAAAQPKNVEAWRSLGRAYVISDKASDAARAYREAVRLDPNDRESWYELGAVYSRLGEQEKVLEVYQKLGSLDKEMAGQFFRAFVLPH